MTVNENISVIGHITEIRRRCDINNQRWQPAQTHCAGLERI